MGAAKRLRTPRLNTLGLPTSENLEPEKNTGVTELRNEPVTEANLKLAWQAFAEKRKAFHAEYQLLQQPFELNGTEVTMYLHNTVQENLLNELRSDLTLHLRQHLKNDNIRVQGKLIIDNTTPVIYTNREKLNYLAEKNPLVVNLIKTLGLDPDF